MKTTSFQDGAERRTRNPEVIYLELPGSMLRIAPE
jgi:hypothetical protein